MNKRSFKIAHDSNMFEFNVVIDMDARGSLEPQQYTDSYEFGDSVKSEIKMMSTFWYGCPKEDADFEMHLKFFLELLSYKIGHFILEGNSSVHYIYHSLNSTEGYFPCFGESIKIDMVYVAHPEDFVEEITIEEVEEQEDEE